MIAKTAYVFFLTACIVAVIIVLLFHAAQLTQPQQDILAATLGGLLMGLQSVIHSIFHTSDPTPPVNPAIIKEN